MRAEIFEGWIIGASERFLTSGTEPLLYLAEES